MVHSNNKDAFIFRKHWILHNFLVQNSTGVLRTSAQPTATYCAVLENSGEVFLGVGDMNIHNQISIQHVSSFTKLLQKWIIHRQYQSGVSNISRIFA